MNSDNEGEKGLEMDKVMVIGRNPLELLGLKTLLKAAFEVKVDTFDPWVAVDQLKKFLPNVVLLDASIDEYDLCELSAQIKEQCPKSKVMWLLSDEDEETELAALKCSIDGCALKTDIDQLPRALRLIQQEEVYFPGSFLKRWLSQIASLVEVGNNRDETQVSLSEREMQIVELVRAGKTNQEISEELFISIETVKSHLKNVRRRMSLKRIRHLSDSPPGAKAQDL